MSKLISGKEAFDAAYNGCEAQWRWTGKDVEWRDLEGGTAFSINELKGGACEFRLKPRTITINGIEVPAPFEPKEDDRVWVIDSHRDCGYGPLFFNSAEPKYTQFGSWRTEDEIRQVVSALRSVFKPQ